MLPTNNVVVNNANAVIQLSTIVDEVKRVIDQKNKVNTITNKLFNNIIKKTVKEQIINESIEVAVGKETMDNYTAKKIAKKYGF